MKRVTVRTLVLMALLLGYFVAYQCLVFLPVKPAPLPARAQTSAPEPADSRAVEEWSENETVLDGPGPWAAGETASLAETYRPGEVESVGRMRPRLLNLAVDPNDHVPPEPTESAEATSQVVE